MKGKRVQFDDAMWLALDMLARDSRRDFQTLANEAFADLLKKHGRPVSLGEALRESARRTAANDPSQGSAPRQGRGGAKAASRTPKGKRPGGR